MIRKIGNKMSLDYRRNRDDTIGMNPSRSIGIPRPQVIRIRLSNCNIFYLVIRGSLWIGIIKN